MRRTELIWLYCILLLASACSASSLRTPSTTSNATSSSFETHTPEAALESATPLNLPTSTSKVFPYRLIRPREFNLNFKLGAPIFPGDYIVGAEDTFTYESEIQLQIISLAGEIISTIEIRQIEESISSQTIVLTQMHKESNRILIGVGDNSNTKELYVYDPDSEMNWGIAIECETPLGDYGYALGAEFLTFRCLDHSHTWHFISTNEPSTGFSIDVPIASGYLDSFPVWVGTEEILF